MTIPPKKINLEARAEVFVKQYMRNYRWLEDLCNDHSVNSLVFDGLLQFLDLAPNLKKENHAINLALILKNKQVTLVPPFLRIKPFHISNYQYFSDLKSAINGNTLCYLVDEMGMVSIIELPTKFKSENTRSTMQKVSEIFQTITLCMENTNLYVFGSGKLAQVRRNGRWLQPCFMEFDALSKEGFPLSLLQQVLNISCILSEQKEGGMFVIVNEPEARFCQPLNDKCICDKKVIDEIPNDQLAGLASMDGAVILNVNGEMLKVGQRLVPPFVGKYFQEAARGTKHNVASQYSKATDSVIFVISEDGPISLYRKGELIGRCFKELYGLNVVIK